MLTVMLYAAAAVAAAAADVLWDVGLTVIANTLV